MNNENDAIANRFKLTFADQRYKLIEDRVTSLIIPGLALRFLQRPTSIRNIYTPGGQMDVLDMSVGIKLDEKWEVWKEIFKWMIKNKNLDSLSSEKTVTDATITVLSSKYNPLFNIILTDVFPYSLGDVAMDIAIQDTVPIKFDVIFKTDSIKIEDV